MTNKTQLTNPTDVEELIAKVLHDAKRIDVENKQQTFDEVTKDWTDEQWKVAQEDVVNSFSSARFPRLVFPLLAQNESVTSGIDTGKQFCGISGGSDAFYLNRTCINVTHGKGRVIEGNDVDRVFLGIYVALERGENYSTASLPPLNYIKEVMGLESVFPQDILATVSYYCEYGKPLEVMARESADRHKDEIGKLREAYNQICNVQTVGKTVSQTTKKAKTFAKKQILKHSNGKTALALKGRIGKKGMWIAWIINGAAVPAKIWYVQTMIKRSMSAGRVLGVVNNAIGGVIGIGISIAILVATGLYAVLKKTGGRVPWFIMIAFMVGTMYSISTIVSVLFMGFR